MTPRHTPRLAAALDRKSRIGRLERGLDEADKRGWLVVSMKNDWRTVYAPVR